MNCCSTGLATCGSGAGTFLLAPLVKNFEDVFGWQGTNRILSGLCLQCIVFGAVLRPLDARQKVPRNADLKQQNTQRDLSLDESLQVPSDWQRLISNIPFLLVSIANLPGVMGLFIPYDFLPVVNIYINF